MDFAAAYAERLAEVGQKGYGMFARHHMFTIEDGSLIPVRFPDPQRLSELPGYEHEREKVIANTKALLSGKPAVNDFAVRRCGHRQIQQRESHCQ